MHKIALIGPESTGKSFLTKQLANIYKTSFVNEYAREFLSSNHAHYNYSDLLFIAQQQIKSEDAIAAKCKKPFLFVDTNMYVMKVWCEFVFNKCYTWILDQIALRSYSFYLLMDIDLPWQQDEMREYPDINIRKRLFLMYKDFMENQAIPWQIVSGQGTQRIENSIQIVDNFIASNKKKGVLINGS